jgi:hypothetical protein
MGHLILQGTNTDYPGFSLLGESSLAITMDETGNAMFDHNTLAFLILSGTTTVSITSNGLAPGDNFIGQLVETTNNLTTVTISGSEQFFLGQHSPFDSNSDDGVVTDIAATATLPTKIQSSLTLIDASATTGFVSIFAGATNTSGAGNFDNGASLNANVTITYTGLVIKGGSGGDVIENDAKNGIVTDGNASDSVILGGAGAKAILGTGIDRVAVGESFIGTNETAGNALGDKVTFGAAATADLIVGTGAEAGSTASTTSIGLTKVHDAADGMVIDFTNITTSSNIVDETTNVASEKTLTAAENNAVRDLPSNGVAYFTYKGNEYFIATNNVESAVSPNDAIVELVGVTDIHHAVNVLGIVTLHV